MAKTLKRLGRLGYFVAMAGVSWVVEACSGSSFTPEDPSTKGGSGGRSGTGGASNTGGTGETIGLGLGGTAGSGGEGGLHDVPCE